MWQFVHYNSVLRRWPLHIFESLKGNTYATTIHCLVSGVTKVSRRTKIPSGLVLYRGFGGLKLPDQFYKAPKGGFKGFVEWGFMVRGGKALGGAGEGRLGRGGGGGSRFVSAQVSVPVRALSRMQSEASYLT